jgi:hypothetical protein
VAGSSEHGNERSGNFLTRWTTISFSRRTLLDGVSFTLECIVLREPGCYEHAVPVFELLRRTICPNVLPYPQCSHVFHAILALNGGYFPKQH